MQRSYLRMSALTILMFLVTIKIAGASVSLQDELDQMRVHQKEAYNSCGNIIIPCLHAVNTNFNSECLSNPLCTISIKAIFQNDGSLKSEIVSAKNNSPSDNFYCQQAVAEYMIKGWPDVPILFDFNAKMPPNMDAAILKETPDDCVALHLIPHTFPGSNFTFKTQELYGKDNILFLKKSKLNDSRLASFRSDWFVFMANHKPLVHDDIVAEAATLKTRYADLFE